MNNENETAFFLLINEQESGPYTRGQIQIMLARGEIAESTPCADDTRAKWQPVGELFKPSNRRFVIAAAVAAVLAVAVAAAAAWYWFEYHHTPKSTVPPPPNVSYKKWQKTSSLSVTLPPTTWEKRLGRNLHRVAYQAATNFVAQDLSRPETAKFAPFKSCEIQGVDWRFRVKGEVQALTKSNNLRKYNFEIFMARGSNEIWTVEYLDRSKARGSSKTDDGE